MDVHLGACDALVNHLIVPGGTPERPGDAGAPVSRLGSSLPHNRRIWGGRRRLLGSPADGRAARFPLIRLIRPFHWRRINAVIPEPKTVTVADRTVGYDEYGHPGGRPVMV